MCRDNRELKRASGGFRRAYDTYWNIHQAYRADKRLVTLKEANGPCIGKNGLNFKFANHKHLATLIFVKSTGSGNALTVSWVEYRFCLRRILLRHQHSMALFLSAIPASWCFEAVHSISVAYLKPDSWGLAVSRPYWLLFIHLPWCSLNTNLIASRIPSVRQTWESLAVYSAVYFVGVPPWEV